MVPKPDDSLVAAWVELSRAQRRASAMVEARLKEAGLPPLAWYDALWELDRAPESGLRPFELEQAMLFEQSNLSRLAERLVKAGLIERRYWYVENICEEHCRQPAAAHKALERFRCREVSDEAIGAQLVRYRLSLGARAPNDNDGVAISLQSASSCSTDSVTLIGSNRLQFISSARPDSMRETLSKSSIRRRRRSHSESTIS